MPTGPLPCVPFGLRPLLSSVQPENGAAGLACTVSRLRQGASEDYSITPIDVVQNISTALGLAASNLAATVSPAYVNPLATSMGLVMRRILKPEAMRQVSLYLPLRRTVSASTTSFVEFLLKWKSGYAQRVTIRSGM